jgi:hypothetical protein
LLLVLLISTACKRSSEGNAGDGSNANSTAATDQTQSTPPFATKEPDRYSATVVTSGSLGPSAASLPGIDALSNQQMFVARDGERRRVDTEMLPGVTVSYLQLANARYVLVPSKKLYAEIKLGDLEGMPNPAQGVPSDFAPDKLVKGTPTGSKYEKLGAEDVNGRMATKYRVTVPDAEGAAGSSETTIWVDESLGLPIKMESVSKDGAKYGMEMRDIKLEADPSKFELPGDYQKVEHRELLSKIIPSFSDLLGTGENSTKGRKP